jgi:hypothetical protein
MGKGPGMGATLHPGPLRAVAVMVFAVVFGLLFVVSDPAEAGALLFVVPIALLALGDGTRGGVVGAVAGTILVVVWVALDDVELGVLGYASRIAAFVLIGLVVGRYEDMARSYERRRIDERYAAELHDRVVQSLVVARYYLDDRPDAQQAVDAALEGAKDIISSRMGEIGPGDLRIEQPHPPVSSPRQRDR